MLKSHVEQLLDDSRTKPGIVIKLPQGHVYRVNNRSAFAERLYGVDPTKQQGLVSTLGHRSTFSYIVDRPKGTADRLRATALKGIVDTDPTEHREYVVFNRQPTEPKKEFDAADFAHVRKTLELELVTETCAFLRATKGKCTDTFALVGDTAAATAAKAAGA